MGFDGGIPIDSNEFNFGFFLPGGDETTLICGEVSEHQNPPGRPDFKQGSNSIKAGSVSSSTTMSYPKWCALLVPYVLRSRTPFSAFLHRSICLLRGPLVRSASTLTFFPVPVFDRDQFRRKPSGLSSLKRRNCHLHRAIHVICMALNFWFFGGRWVADDELKREPNAEHINLYARLASLIRSDGLAESFNLAKSGRKHPELLARLSELSNLLTVQGGASCGYEKGFAGVDVPKDSSAAPELTPFVDLDASRLRIYGSGHWDVTSHLHDELVLAYREPRSLLADLPLGDHPKCRDSQEEVAKLAHLWDQAGLLRLSRCQRPLGSLVKVFNCYKNAEMDRQIGDRRGQNSLECRIAGPSRELPAGPDMMDLQVDMNSQKIVVIITDRKDYYHQLWVSPARASTNAVGPSIHADLVKDTGAYSAFCLQSSMQKRQERAKGRVMLSTTSLSIQESPQRLSFYLWITSGLALAQFCKEITWGSRLQLLLTNTGSEDTACLMKPADWSPLAA